MSSKILIAEDEEITLKHILSALEKEGYEVTGVLDGRSALEEIDNGIFDILITDIKMPGLTGIELLGKVRESSPDTEVIIITGYGSITSVVDAMKKGARDYITKPFDLEELVLKVKQIHEEKIRKQEIIALKMALGVDKEITSVAKSQSMKNIVNVVESIKNSDCNVLLAGESGVGKSMIAKMVHYTSRRQDKPFVSVNCAALTEDLLANELFGYEKGAFAGAVKTKQGLLEIADMGTLFLEGITDMSANLQEELQIFIEGGEFFRLGGTKPIKTNVRFIVATSTNINALVSEGRFRKDLYYRLNGLEIYVPPLKERREAVEPLSKYFLEKHLPKSGKRITGFTKEAIDLLTKYSFPGNVRELENIVEHAIILEKSSQITVESLPLKNA